MQFVFYLAIYLSSCNILYHNLTKSKTTTWLGPSFYRFLFLLDFRLGLKVNWRWVGQY